MDQDRSFASHFALRGGTLAPIYELRLAVSVAGRRL